MKSFVLLCVVGLVAVGASVPSQLKWDSGREYVFDYSSRMLTGLPELAHHYSGLGLQAQVSLIVRRTWSGGNSFTIQVNNARFVKVNQKLNPSNEPNVNGNEPESEGYNWRNIQLPQFQEVPADAKRFLEIPTEFDLTTSGSFSSLKVSQAEPHWSINFKKALVVLFQTKFEHEFGSGSENDIPSSDEEIKMVNWYTQEQALDGVCDNYYQIQQVPEANALLDPEIQSFRHQCDQSDKVFKILRTRDIDSCTRRTSFKFIKPGFFRCTEGNCDGMWSRTSITKYYACGSMGHLKIQTIVNEGELRQNLLGFEVEKYTTGAQQKLQLRTSRSISSIPPPSSDSITITDLMYVYNAQAAHNNISAGQLDSAQVKPQHIVKGPVDPNVLIPQIKKVINELVNHDLNDLPNLPKKKVTEKSLQVARALSLLNHSQVNQVYQECKQQFSSEQQATTFKNIFFDLVTMAGAYDNIYFLQQQIQQGELQTQQLASVFMFLPNYVIVPSQRVLDLIFEIATCDQVKQKEMVYNQAIMSLATLVHNACVSPVRNQTYPAHVYGEQCHPDSSIINRRLLPYLQRQLLSETVSVERKNMYIVSLGLLGHRDIVPLILPMVESNYTGSDSKAIENNRLTRYVAVYALDRVGRQYRNLVVPNLLAVLLNPGETTDIRVAAFNTILKIEPTMPELHTIAGMTWKEKNNEVVRVVFKALRSLAQQPQNSEILRSPLSGLSLVRKAKVVFPLVKKNDEISSGTTYTSSNMGQLGASTSWLSSWLWGKDTESTTDLYSRTVYLLEQFQFTPCEFAFKMQGTENLIQQLAELFSSHTKQQTKSRFSQQVVDRITGEWKEVIQKLSIQSRDDKNTQGLIFLNLFESTPIFHSIQASTSQMLKEKFDKIVGTGSSASSSSSNWWCGESNVNFQKMFDGTPDTVLVPFDLGFPLVIELHNPTTISTTGKINVDCSNNNIIPKVNMQVKALVVSQYTGWIGTVLPFTEEYILTAIDEHSIMNLPAEIDVQLQPDNQELNIKLKPISGLSGPVDVMHYHVRPYTVIQKVWNLDPMSLNAQAKQIQSSTPARQYTKKFDNLGFDIEAILTTESAFSGLRSNFQALQWYNYNPLNSVLFRWGPVTISQGGKPSIRRHEFQLRYNPNGSSAREVDINVKVGYASKLKQGQIKYHMLQRETNPSQQFSYPAWQNILPLRLQSQNIDQVSQQSERRGFIKSLMEKTGLDYGRCYTTVISVNFVGGSRPKNVKVSTTIAAGFKGLKEKWNVEVLNHNGKGQLCINGHVDLGQEQLPVWKLNEVRNKDFNFQYENLIGFGDSSCSEQQIKMTGNSQTSQKQKQWSRQSPEAQLWEQLQQNQTLKEFAEVSELKEKLLTQASTLDQVNFRIEYQNVDWRSQVFNNYLLEAIQYGFFPYTITNNSTQQQQQDAPSGPRFNFYNEYQLRYNPNTDTFNMTINVPNRQQNILFKNVQIPYMLRAVYPVSGLQKGYYKQGLFRPTYYQCQLKKNVLKTYENTTRKIDIDGCFHLLTADCSYSKKFAVLAKAMDQSHSSKQLKVHVGNTQIDFIPQSSSSMQIKVNGSQVQPSGSEMTVDLKEHNEKFIAQIIKSKDNVYTIKMAYYTWVGVSTIYVNFDGDHIQTSVFPFYQGSMCGLCGDITGSKINGMRGPKQCVYSKPELLTASYRVSLSGNQCSPLPPQIQQEFQREQNKCVQTRPIFTKIDKVYTSPSQCTRLSHEIIERPFEMCFSRLPVMDCSPNCRPSGGQRSTKQISFTCMNKGHKANEYVQRIRQGQIINELRDKREYFQAGLPLPRRCEQ